ncbi:MAG: hypothetical protein MPN21_28075 [Thermoanaerobaculia bacterium]|nr:hypothetical protein [Thermoanaerobaculia bacterium]
MSNIVVLSESTKESRTAVVAATRRHFDLGIKEILDRQSTRRPLVEVRLFGNDHDEVTKRLVGLLDELQRAGALFTLFELEEAQGFVSRDAHDLSIISRQELDNILQAADDEMARQRKSMDLEAGFAEESEF